MQPETLPHVTWKTAKPVTDPAVIVAVMAYVGIVIALASLLVITW